MDSITERHLSLFGAVYYFEKLIEESIEVRDAFKNDGYKEQMSEVADVINVTNKIKAHLERVYGVSSDKLELDISNVIEEKNRRTDERIKSNYYNNIQNAKHEYVDLGDLSEGDREMVMNVIAACRRKR